MRSRAGPGLPRPPETRESYLGWIPALRLPQPATEEPPPRTGLMIAAHVVWGAAAAALLRRL
jgi:hypothetical protein